MADDDSTLTVDNQSDFVIEDIRVTEVGNDDWGRNLIPEALFPGEIVDIEVDCGFYDARLIDEDNVACYFEDIDLCLNDAVWVVRNNSCTVWEAARQAREAEAARKAAPELKNAPAEL